MEKKIIIIRVDEWKDKSSTRLSLKRLDKMDNAVAEFIINAILETKKIDMVSIRH